MRKVRPWWIPPFAAFDFLETNVRLYVLYNNEPGVFFLSLEAASWLAVQAARIGWGLPYYYAKMNLKKQSSDHHYETRRRSGVGLKLDYTIEEAMGESLLGSAEFFFLERYLLFVERGGAIFRGQVHHPPYPAYKATLHNIDENLTDSHGIPCSGMPTFVHASPGVEVDVFALKKQGLIKRINTH